MLHVEQKKKETVQFRFFVHSLSHLHKTFSLTQSRRPSNGEIDKISLNAHLDLHTPVVVIVVVAACVNVFEVRLGFDV